MKTAAVLLAMCALCSDPAAGHARRGPAHRSPVVVELFTAQGCASCNAADGAIGKLADQDGDIVLTWPVDYWDYLGWKDTFAQPEFTERQRAYERRLSLRDVYTPQVIVQGAAQVSGDDGGAILDLVAKAKRTRALSPEIEFRRGDRIAVGSGRAPGKGCDVWLVRFDPHPKDVEVKAGDNRGARVSETNVVRQVVRLGRWSGRPSLYTAPAADQEGLGEVVLVQQQHDGPIVGARKKPALS
jgi:hypothetical protein